MKKITSIKSAPKIMQIYMCNYPDQEHTEKPEFYKNRPVVIGKKATLHGVVTIVPITGYPQDKNPNSLRIQSPIDGRDAWVVCNHIHTVSTKRLYIPKGGITKIQENVFQEILAKVCRNLPLSLPEN